MKKTVIGFLAPALGLLLMLAWPASAPAQQNGTETTPVTPGAFAQQPGDSEAADNTAAGEEAVTATDLPASPALPSTGPTAPAPAPAGPDKTAAAAGPSTGFSMYGLDLVKALGAFVLVLVLLVLALKALGRLGRYRSLRGRGSVFELRGIQALDNRKFLAAVEVEGRLIVVGVTPDRITPVAHWTVDQFTDDEGLDFSAPHPATREADLEFKLPADAPRPGRRPGRLDGHLDISVADPEEPEK